MLLFVFSFFMYINVVKTCPYTCVIGKFTFQLQAIFISRHMLCELTDKKMFEIVLQTVVCLHGHNKLMRKIFKIMDTKLIQAYVLL